MRHKPITLISSLTFLYLITVGVVAQQAAIEAPAESSLHNYDHR